VIASHSPARSVDLTVQALNEASGPLARAKPLQMLNLLRFRSHARYDGHDNLATPCSGQEAYLERYVPAFDRVAGHLDVTTRIIWIGAVGADVVAPDGEHWDMAAVVEYPDFTTFRRITESNEYLTDADPHRQAALEDWRLVATTPTGRAASGPSIGGRSASTSTTPQPVDRASRRSLRPSTFRYLGRPARMWIEALSPRPGSQ
jgi:hypothetical protein